MDVRAEVGASVSSGVSDNDQSARSCNPTLTETAVVDKPAEEEDHAHGHRHGHAH